jgi:FMN phosphatase YigB (HAD superfamily)
LKNSTTELPGGQSVLRGFVFNHEACIFDFDGTLYSKKNFARRLVLAGLQKAGPREVFTVLAERRARKSLSGRDCGTPAAYYEEFFSRMSHLGNKPVKELRSWYFEDYMPRMCAVLKRHYRPRPGAADLFAGLAKASIPFAVYSDYPQTAERLAALGLDPAGGKLYGPGHFGAQKPAPRPFLSIAENLGVSPSRVLVIGDRDDTDGDGAKAAGMAYFGINNPADWEIFRGCVQKRVFG